MRRRLSFAVIGFCALWALAAPARADLKTAMKEPNLEKRSDLALSNADAALKAARKAYEKDDDNQVVGFIAEILESVELADRSLKDTGKDPRRSPKYFKRAEIATRNLLRQIEDFERSMSVADRPEIEKIKPRIQQVHDQLLLGLMEGNKK